MNLFEEFENAFAQPEKDEPKQTFIELPYIEAFGKYNSLYGPISPRDYQHNIYNPAMIAAGREAELNNIPGIISINPIENGCMVEYESNPPEGHSILDLVSKKVINYTHMPEGLKEAQTANGVHNHFEFAEPKVTHTQPVPDELQEKYEFPEPTEFEVEQEKVEQDLFNSEKLFKMEPYHPVDINRRGFKVPEPQTTPMLTKALQQSEAVTPMFVGSIDPYKMEESYTPALIFKDGKMVSSSKPVDEVPEEEKKAHKLRASQIEEHGIIFDSKLENYMYNLLNSSGIKFRFQVTYELQPAFVYRHESIRPINIVMDFVLDEFDTIIDTKGWQLQDNKIKHKMLKKHLHDLGKEMRIEMPSSQTKCRKLIDMLRNGFQLEEPLTESAGTARKNKLKKNGWEYKEGSWMKNGFIFEAGLLMSYPKYEFEELLLNHNAKKEKIDDQAIWIASWAIGKDYNAEQVRWSDYLYGKEEMFDEVWEYVTECQETGTKAFYEKYKEYKLY